MAFNIDEHLRDQSEFNAAMNDPKKFEKRKISAMENIAFPGMEKEAELAQATQRVANEPAMAQASVAQQKQNYAEGQDAFDKEYWLKQVETQPGRENAAYNASTLKHSRDVKNIREQNAPEQRKLDILENQLGEENADKLKKALGYDNKDKGQNALASPEQTLKGFKNYLSTGQKAQDVSDLLQSPAAFVANKTMEAVSKPESARTLSRYISSPAASAVEDIVSGITNQRRKKIALPAYLNSVE